MPDFSRRAVALERMDCPDSPVPLLVNTLRQFQWINRVLTPCRRLLRRHLLQRMRADRTRAWTMLDIGSGGCDLPIWLIDRCRRERISLSITCIDHDVRVIEFARRRLAAYPEIVLRHGDALTLAETPPGSWDFIFSNHFLHHLSTPEIRQCLHQVVRACREQCIMSDLVRSRLSYCLYTAAAGLVLRNSFAFDDGRLSIRRSLTKAEALQLVAEDPVLRSLRVRTIFPGHLVFL
ncbi:MAG: methyltransferase domain-containing protein [Planctomycetia bacterium]|nr:methyltransferase domain-containing protein [Planctomycetia bacterium]